MKRRIGLDAHGTGCTSVVIGESGKKLRQDVIETDGAALAGYLRNVPGREHLCLEEGTEDAPGSTRSSRRTWTSWSWLT